MKTIWMAVTVAALMTACGAKQSQPAAAKTPAPAPPAAAAADAPRLSGKVVETLDAAGYTYLKIATPDGEKWAAVPATKVAKGQSVAIDEQMVAENFESKTLNRKFDKIVFGTIAGSKPAPPAAMASGAQSGDATQHMQAPDAGEIKVAKAEGGKTVAEIWAAKENGKEVVVRGKVVKFLAGIMGKNWLHLRDGSGSKSTGDDDITVTTNETAVVGDVVIVRGKVAVDKDFGAGYRYPVIIEEAKLSK